MSTRKSPSEINYTFPSACPSARHINFEHDMTRAQRLRKRNLLIWLCMLQLVILCVFVVHAVVTLTCCSCLWWRSASCFALTPSLSDCSPCHKQPVLGLKHWLKQFSIRNANKSKFTLWLLQNGLRASVHPSYAIWVSVCLCCLQTLSPLSFACTSMAQLHLVDVAAHCTT